MLRNHSDKNNATTINADDFPLLIKQEVDQLKEAFKKKDRNQNGIIYKFDVIDVLRSKYRETTAAKANI